MMIMVIKGQRFPESHRQAIRDGLNRYYSMNDMSQERKDNISKGQKKHLAERDASQIQAHKEAITKGTRKYYETHDGPWKIPHTEETKKRISNGMFRYWQKRKHQQQEDHDLE